MAYGNPSRSDDGLGPALAAAFEDKHPDLDVAWRYQPAIEDAAEIAAYEAVVFADAARTGAAPFSFGVLPPAVEAAGGFTSHAFTPAAVLYLARVCFRATTPAYLLAIRGYEFAAFREGLSAGAAENLRCAVAFLREWLNTSAATGGAAVLATASLARAGKDKA
ncbi:MAG: hydrogenase maturation protease [Planctomycetota bacterium]|nr:hydrogenase maturation protease [Planctomycetota bacterium]